MEALLEEQDLWDVVSGAETAPTTGPNSKVTKAFHRKRQLARAKIILHLTSSQLPHARVKSGDPKDIWDNLTNIHQSCGFGRIFAMLRELSSMEKGPDQSMQTWVASIQDLAFRLKGAGFEVPETIIIVTLLRGLPAEYSSLITTIGTTPLDDLSTSSIVTQMLNEESCQQPTPSTATIVLMAKRLQHHDKRKLKPEPRKKTRCFKCQGHGHIAANCPTTDTEMDGPEDSNNAANLAHHRTESDLSSLSCY